MQLKNGALILANSIEIAIGLQCCICKKEVSECGIRTCKWFGILSRLQSEDWASPKLDMVAILVQDEICQDKAGRRC